MKKLYGMFFETRNGMEKLSIGRVILFITFCTAMYRWLAFWQDIPPTMSTFLVLSLGYVVGGKAIDGLGSGLEKVAGAIGKVKTTVFGEKS